MHIIHTLQQYTTCKLSHSSFHASLLLCDPASAFFKCTSHTGASLDSTVCPPSFSLLEFRRFHMQLSSFRLFTSAENLNIFHSQAGLICYLQQCHILHSVILRLVNSCLFEIKQLILNLPCEVSDFFFFSLHGKVKFGNLG